MSLQKSYNLSKIYHFFLDLIYPKYCVGCGKEGTWLCQKCSNKIIVIKKPFCPSCNRLTPRGQFCSRCRKKTYLTGAIISAYYKEGSLKEAIHTFKYDGIFDLASDLGQIMIKALNIRKICGNYILIPVPLYKTRLAQRGFNQAELLTKFIINHRSGFKLIKNKLKRIRASEHQVNLGREERIKNVTGQFEWFGDHKDLKGKKIILVDDIYTTGATLNECAKILRKKTGVKEVWGLVVAKH